MRLTGKVIIIGGGAGGSGEAVSRRLAAEGAHVAIGDFDFDGAERLAAEIGDKASAHRFDLRDRASITAMIESVAAVQGRLDGVHMIAGNPTAMPHDADLLALDFDIWQSQIDAHLYGYAQAAKTAIPLMTGGGSIVFTSSNSCRGVDVTRLGYQTAKAGVETMTRHVARRYGKQGIRCNTLSYGMILTERAKAGLPQKFIDAGLANAWSPRLGKPDDVAGIATLLHSDDGEWITGQVIDVNGGALVRG
ncbi:SDR family NAD(P)-dependent oxidoreductase [Sphingomonas montanisoli]|nr:SDR family oxidoreductase [Sphingomonas montanisoli]